MRTLVSSVARLEARIKDYQKEATELAEVMPYARAWYALRSQKGWLFGPSKFIGYEDLNAKQYLESKRAGLDGRVTEGVLQKWSELVEPGHPKYDELQRALNEFFARFGKKPNSLARISIVDIREGKVATGPMFPDDLVPLLVAVYRKLTPAQKSAFRKQVAVPPYVDQIESMEKDASKHTDFSNEPVDSDDLSEAEKKLLTGEIVSVESMTAFLSRKSPLS